MTLRVTSIEPTPNPNAIRCVIEGDLGGSIRSFRSADAARADPIGRALFEIDGVANVLINGEGGWISVNKSPRAEWATVKRGVRTVLGRVDGVAWAQRPSGD